MLTDTTTGLPGLARLLTEALALADSLDLPIAAIRIDEALGEIVALDPMTPDSILATAG